MTTPKPRRTRAQIAQLERQIYDVLATDNPQSVRHVFYRMTDPRLPEPVDKTEQGYEQVGRRMSAMRRRGDLPYGWVSDATRRGYHVETYRDAGEYLRAMAGMYRADLWRGAAAHVEVWVESRSMAGVILHDCEALAVSLYPAGGFSSLTFTYEAAEAIRHEIEHGKRSVEVLYIGDFDPAGVLIDGSIETELREHLGDTAPLTFHRLAVNEDQIARYNLPTKPRKAGDLRRPDIRATVEAEAMPAGNLRAMLRAKVESFLPAGAIERAKVAEASEREWIETMARAKGRPVAVRPEPF